MFVESATTSLVKIKHMVDIKMYRYSTRSICNLVSPGAAGSALSACGPRSNNKSLLEPLAVRTPSFLRNRAFATNAPRFQFTTHLK